MSADQADPAEHPDPAQVRDHDHGSALVERVVAAGRAAGLVHVGVAGAEAHDDTEAALRDRRAAGHHAAMSFTFKNPRRSCDPRSVLPSARSVVAGAWRYQITPPERPAGAAARVARYAWRDHYADLRGALEACAAVLRDAGYRAVIVADQNSQVDRAAAAGAGIGWFGKNTNLLLDDLGSWFVLGTVVTDAALPPVDAGAGGEPASGCRACTRCLTSCPTDAFAAPGVLDARRCLAWLLQTHGTFPRAHREALGDRIYGCDECLEVCPPGRRADDADLVDRPVPPPRRRRPDLDPVPAATAAPEAWVDVVDLLARTDDDLLDRHGRWYVPRRDPQILRRNALVVLGNIGDGTDPAHVAALHDALADDRPLVRAHAVWAAGRLGRHDLLEGLAAETDPVVRAELALVPPARTGSAV